jgi:hypothetical protein
MLIYASTHLRTNELQLTKLLTNSTCEFYGMDGLLRWEF